MRVLTVVNSANPSAYDASMLLAAYFSSQGIENDVVLSVDIPTPEHLAMDASDGDHALKDVGIRPFDMAVALGGDGTILRTARVAMLFDAPVLGINFGHLGFLANPSEEGVIPLVAAALAGDVTEDRRAGLLVEVVCEGDDVPGGSCGFDRIPHGAYDCAGGKWSGERGDVHGGKNDDASLGAEAAGTLETAGTLENIGNGGRVFTALNEVTISRGSFPRNLEAHLSISGDGVCTLRGDGLIVATATGSTAYALSAGGPLVSPGVEGMVIVPLSSHTLQSRAIVTERHDVVEVAFDFAEGYTFTEVQLDGTALSFPAPIERVVVRCAEKPVRLLFYKKESFYSRISRTFF